MSVIPSDLVTYGSANMPEADGVTIGGALDTTKRVAWYDLSTNDTINAVGSAPGDTGVNLRVMGRNAGGTAITSAIATLNGVNPVPNVGTLGTVERLLAGVITGGTIAGIANPAGTAATGDVAVYRATAVVTGTAQTAANSTATAPALITLAAGQGASVAIGQIVRITNNLPAGVNNQLRQIIATVGYGTDVVAVSRDWSIVPTVATTYTVLQGMLFEILPNPVRAITRLFATSAADAVTGSTRIFYEKVFVTNNNTVTDLTLAQVQVASNAPTLPGAATLDIALTTALNDTNTSTNRQTVPAAGVGSFVTQPAFVNVPGAGSLPAGAAPNTGGSIGVWLRLTLPAGTTAYKGAATLRAQGSTT